jgi:formylglycine-generating enzyme required for sulfatase activity
VPRAVSIEAGTLSVGPGDWEAQGVVLPHRITLAAFTIDAFEVTEDRYTVCLAAGECAPVPLTGEPGRALAGVTLSEAARFCAWARGALPSSAELAFAAAGTGGRRYPWGDTGAVCRRAAWGLGSGPCAEGASGPELAGSHPDGASPQGIHDLAGNVAEWTIPDEPGALVADVRGGSWADSAAASLRSWHRREIPVGTRSPEIGFRCVYRPPAP